LPPPGDELAEYKRALARLVTRGRKMAQSKWSPTPARRALGALAAQAESLGNAVDARSTEASVLRGEIATLAANVADSIECGSAWFAIELEIGREACSAAVGELRDLAAALREQAAWDETSGLRDVAGSASAENRPASPSYDDAQHALRTITEAARAAEKRLPQANEKPVQRYLALMFVYLRVEYGRGFPKSGPDGADVKELDGLLRDAQVGGKYGDGPDDDTLDLTHTLLVKARQLFDPFARPPGYDEIV
jgi:hypothetical protein